MPAIALEQISKHFGEIAAVDSLSLRVDEGWMFGLLGPNGAGKTTTIRMILNIIRPDRGTILLWDQSERGLTDRVGYLPEERGLYRKMKVLDLLVFLAALKGMGAREAQVEAHRWLEKLELEAWSDKKVETLSKGMQQQVQFIACVLHKPDLLILDEPFTGLDPVNTNRLKDIILKLNEQGTTIILSTHRMEQVEKLCSYICLINGGRKLLDGRLSDIKREYGHNTIRLEFEGSRTFLENNPLIDKMDLYDQYAEVRLKRSADPQELLRAAVDTARVRKFEIVEPSLNDIFIEKVTQTDGDET